MSVQHTALFVGPPSVESGAGDWNRSDHYSLLHPATTVSAVAANIVVVI